MDRIIAAMLKPINKGLSTLNRWLRNQSLKG